MSWSQAPYDEGVYAAGQINPAAPPNQIIPPPIPGATTQFSWNTRQGAYPWMLGGWSGITLPAQYLGGGLVVSTDDGTATAQIRAWWPDIAVIQLVRITADGTRTPVRGAYSVQVQGFTRRNACTNPNVRTGLNGYVPGVGSPQLSTIQRTDIVDTAWRATIASAGTCEVVVPQALLGGRRSTVALDLRFSARPTSCTITVGWNDLDGVALTATAVSLTADQINFSVNQFGRQVIMVTPPAAAAVASTLKVSAGGLPAHATMDGSHVLVEAAQSDGSYVDGDTLGGQWDGVTELSSSTIAPVQTIVDGECPLDVPVYYAVVDSAIGGGQSVSPTVILNSNGRSWVTHPANPTTPVECFPTVTQQRVYKLPQSINPVIGRPNPLVVSAANRNSASTTISLDCETFTMRDALLDMFSDGQPILFRAPVDFGCQSEWIALGDLTEDPGGRPAYVQTRTLTAPYQVVDPPATAGLLTVS